MIVLALGVSVIYGGGRVDRILDAAYACFLRHGIRKTTMDDIAGEAGMSRPAVYQYVRGKEDAYRRLAGRLYAQAYTQARAAAGESGTLTQRLDRVLAVRLGLLHRLETPHAAELIGEQSRVAADLIGEQSRVAADLDRAFTAELTDLLTQTIAAAAAEADMDLGDSNAREVAELALALARGLETDRSGPDRARDRLRNGVALLVAGLAAAAQPRLATAA